MAFNGSGVFDIDTAGQPVVDGTTIDATVFNALTADLASGLSTCITKDGQQTVTANIPMAGYKFTGMGIGTAATESARVDNANVLNMCEGRLTLTTGVPVTTSDVTAAETLYFTPYKGNRIALYDGTNWLMRSFTELSIDVPDATNCYDVFAYDNSGTVALELLAWTNETTRATALVAQNGVLCKTGALTRRYLGTFYCTTAGNGQIEDSLANRYLWNYYNRVARPMRVTIQGATPWTYTTATIRQANNNTGNQLNFCIGVAEDAVVADGYLTVQSTQAAGAVAVYALLGLDSTTAGASNSVGDTTLNMVTNIDQAKHASLKLFTAVGKHYIALLEFSSAAGTSTWCSSNPSGLTGMIWG